MSTLRVTFITNKDENGPVEFTTGLTIPSGQSIDGDLSINTATGIITGTSLESTNVNVTGVVTATSYSGIGAGLTNLPGTLTGKAISYGIIA